MTKTPSFAMQVSDLSQSLDYLTRYLGFTLLEEKQAEDVAYVLDIDGDPLLLAGPTVQDVSSYLSPSKFVLKPGETLSFRTNNIASWQTTFSQRGVTDVQISHNRLGDQVLRIKAPDNYTFEFIQLASHSFEALLEMYARSLAELDEALAGLSEDAMDLALSADSWNIRQIVHHIADSYILFGQSMKVALSSPGTQMEQPTAIGNERYSTGPEFRDRPVASSLALSHAFYVYIVDIVKYIPNAGEHSIEDHNGHKTTFSQLIHLLVVHTGEHLEEIWQIRRKYAK